MNTDRSGLNCKRRAQPIDNLNGTHKKPDFDLSLIRFWLVLKRGG
jgi:hypothetical protein